MSKKSNPTLIGAFVVGALTLLAVGVAIFGGAELFAKRDVYVAYFTENTKGLRVGSNVEMNGVRVGFVSGMALIIDEVTFESTTEVTLEVLPEAYIVTRDVIVVSRGIQPGVTADQVINEGGLRATLQIESFVTGQLLVELQFRPDTKAVLRGSRESAHPEIPTIPSRVQETVDKLQGWLIDFTEGFDAREIGQRVESILRGVDELANSRDMRESLAGINSFINKEDTQELPTTLDGTLDQLRAAASDAGSLLRNADTKVDDLDPVIERLKGTLDEAERALAAAGYQLEGDSTEVYQLDATLKEVEGAARALRELLDYLQRNPEALLRGKSE